MDNVLVISNFNAGRKKAILYKKLLTKFLLSNSKKFKFISIDEFDSTIISDFDTIITIGGDGTVNKAVSKIIGTSKELICLPSGTANLLAYNLGMTNSLKTNLKIVENGNKKKIDVIKINDKYSVLRCGIGYDSDIICKTPQSIKNKFGYLSYFVAGILFALRLKTKSYNLKFNGKIMKANASCIIISNASNMYRNIISTAKNSKVDDGLLDIFILKTQNPIVFFYEFIRILLNIKSNNSRAEYYQTDSIYFTNNWTACHIDGEKQILKGDTLIEIYPKKLTVYCK